jgi:hypothetical protein
MTAANVTDLVRTRFPEASIGSVDVVSEHLFGSGEVSTAGRVVIRIGDVDGAVLPNQLVVKVARPDLPATPLYQNEVAVYTHLRDQLAIETPSASARDSTLAPAAFH